MSLQANISNTPFDQKSPGHPEVGVLNGPKHKDRWTDIATLCLNQPRGRISEKIIFIFYSR